jgi:SAM-dependent methyltransferase
VTRKSIGGLRVSLARTVVAGARRLQSALSAIERAIEARVGATLQAALDIDEREDLSIALYDDAFNPDNDFAGLYPWEKAWLARRLPPAPARLLIGAAGSGREAVALQSLGYSVVALEPSERAAEHCERQLQPGSTVVRGSYRELVEAVVGGGPLHSSLTPSDPFDAVLLGWGSFGHVLREEQRFALLEACDALCPDGPILLSVFLPPAQARLPSAAETDISFAMWGGFLAVPTAEELTRHAKALGRELIARLDNASPHFTLVPKKTTSAARANPGLPEPEH